MSLRVASLRIASMCYAEYAHRDPDGNEFTVGLTGFILFIVCVINFWWENHDQNYIALCRSLIDDFV